MSNTFQAIAAIHTDFPSKFGIPRQSGMVPELLAEIIFEPGFRRREALLGIEEYSHLWLLWDFSEARKEHWSPVVFPPRLGGKVKRGVFATRSPFRPNSIGLSCVKLEQVMLEGGDCPKLIVSGADLMDGTPIYDIKPYLPYTDAHPEARGSFGEEHKSDGIKVCFPKQLLEKLPLDKRTAAVHVLEQDPRAAYNKQPHNLYGMQFAGYDIRFMVSGDVLTVCEVVDTQNGDWKKVK